MALTPGTRLGVYEIIAAIGAGGMGAVFRARDTKLDRDVAIKILPEAFAHEADRLARFTREARTLASLNHPHIAAIYGLEESRSGGSSDPPITALVMELVEGEDLSQRIAQGAIPIDEALAIARQIAEALEAAHEQGIIHRDLKPANIKVRADGTVKVLDFGLAKALDGPAQAGPHGGRSDGRSVRLQPDLSASPTLTSPAMTQAGVILGTAAYMAPEQARGRAVDKRADIWSFGCVLYEMLTGRRAFPGEDITDTLAAVVRAEPEWALLPAGLSSALVTYLRRCLHKDPKQRIPDIAAMRLALEGAFEAAAPQTTVAAAPAARPPWRRALPVAGAAAVGVLLTAALAWRLWPAPTPAAVSRFSYVLPNGETFRNTGRNVLAVSPNGRRFVYNTARGLVLRSLDDLEAHVIPGTEGGLTNPFFAPDGESIGYWQEGQLKRLTIGGSAPVVIGPVTVNPFGASWGRDDTILVCQPDGILRVPATGGTPAVVIPAQAGERLSGSPQLLPDGDTVLFTASTVEGTAVRIAAQRLSTGERTTLVEGGFGARYVPTGHLVYVVGGVLTSVAFDARRLAVIGPAVPLVRGVRSAGGVRLAGDGSAPLEDYGLAEDGTLVWVRGETSAGGDTLQLVMADREDRLSALPAPAGPYHALRVSPDGTRLAVGVADPREAYIAIYDLDGRTALRRLTFGGNNRYPVWSRDGQRVTFQSDREGDLAIFWQRADGTGPAERLTTPAPDTAHVPASWSPKDETLLFTAVPAAYTARPGAIWTYTRARQHAEPFGGVQEAAQSPMFSPDGRWVTYAERPGEGGIGVFVQPFPATGARYQLPSLGSNTGSSPVWSSDGRSLFFAYPDRLAVVSVTTQPTIAFGNPTTIARRWRGSGSPASFRNWDVTPDGRFVGLAAPGEAEGEIRIALNWFEELTRLVPTE